MTKLDLPPVREMERASRARDASYDGIFYLAVTSTGIFCRPSCPARKPHPIHMHYFSTSREALFAGFRPCKRCRPLETSGKPPEWVVSLLDDMAKNPEARIRDADLRARGLEPATVRRHFLKNYGMTFQSYSRGMRMSKALEQIRLGKNLDEVTLGHGYESFSGFREAFANVFGQSPGRSREEDCVVVTWFESPLGPLVAGANSKAICLLEFTDPRRLEGQFSILQKRFECAIMPGENEHLLRLKSELEQYFSRKRTSFSLPLLYPGTPFQTKVWTELLKIPYGETISYEELSLRIGSPGAQRAVGHANGQNRISILIPCHRVVNKNGALGGYGGGLWRKKWLLQLEQNRNRILIP